VTTSRETVHNRPLSGAELKQLLRLDFDKLLSNHGMLSDHLGFGRVAYRLSIHLDVDNPYNPNSEASLESKPSARNIIAGGFRDPDTGEPLPARPELEAVGEYPLTNPTADAAHMDKTLQRVVSSPNEERLRMDLPVPVMVSQQDGTKTLEHIKYPKQDVGEGDLQISDSIHLGEAESRAMAMPSVREAASTPPSAMCHCGGTYGNHALSGVCNHCKVCKEFRDFNVPLPKGEEAWPVEAT
jgi:hypothetical protein